MTLALSRLGLKIKKYYFNKLKNKFYQSSNHDGDTATGEASNQSL